MDAGLSGGTIESLVEVISDTSAMQKLSGSGYDPLYKKIGSKEISKADTIFGIQFTMNYSSVHEAWVGLMVLAFGNFAIIKRSNALLEYNECLTYEEALVYQNFFDGFLNSFVLVFLGTLFFIDPLFYLVREYVLPKVGTGPSVEE